MQRCLLVDIRFVRRRVQIVNESANEYFHRM